MSQEILQVLMRSTPAEARQRLNLPARDLDAQVLQLTASLNGELESPESQAVFSYVRERCHEEGLEAQRASRSPIYAAELAELRDWANRRFLPNYQPVTPEIMEWARRTFNEEEFLAGLREIEATGGVEITDLIQEPEQEATSRE
jgi:hypothetical protein